MSMQTDCLYGRGFKVYVSDENLRDFIYKHTFTLLKLGEQGKELAKWIRERPTSSGLPLDSLKERFFDWDNENTGDTGLYGMIADVMSKETGINFEFRNPQEGDAIEDDVIMLPQVMPWQYNEVEKKLTEEKLDEIFKKYIDELGGQLVVEDIRLEYFG